MKVGGWAALAVAMAIGSPAEAHCYQHWAYPRPQSGCGGVYARVRHHVDLKINAYARARPAAHAALEVEPPKQKPDPAENAGDGVTPQPTPLPDVGGDHDWYVEITKMPPVDELVARQDAVAKLREIMK